VVIVTNNRVSVGAPRLTIPEQNKGNILLKEWEHNIVEGKQQALKITNSLEEALNSIDSELLGIDNGGDAETLMQMNVEHISLDLKEKEERDSTDISQMTVVDMVQVDRCMIKPNTQLCAINIIDGQMEDRIHQLTQKCYFFEASCQAEPSQLISHLVDRCITCTELTQRQTPGTK
jgi:hypothetical protein